MNDMNDAIRGFENCLGRRLRALVGCDRGQDVAEMAIVLPFLLVIMLGVVEFGSMFGAQQTLTSIGREGANIAARGASLDTVNALVLESGSEIDLETKGGAISSLIVVQDSVPRIVQQVTSAGYATMSHLGQQGDPAAGLGQVAGDEGASFYVVEVFYAPGDVTPLRRLLGESVPETLYSRAVF